jgi:hypothetical protein
VPVLSWTATRWPPGVTVSSPVTVLPLQDTSETIEAGSPLTLATSWLSRDAVSMTPRATVTLWPAASLPADGVTVSSPARLADTVADHDTGPPEALKVRAPPSVGPSAIVVGVTLSVPCAGAGGVGVAEGVLLAVLVAVALPVGGAGEAGGVL